MSLDDKKELTGNHTEETDIIEIVAEELKGVNSGVLEDTTSEIRSSATDLVALSPELKKMFPSKQEQIYLFELKWEYGWDLDKLDEMHTKLIWTKIERVKKMLEESSYEIEKLEYIFWKETIEKMQLVMNKVSSIKKWEITYEQDEENDWIMSGFNRKTWRELVKKLSAFTKGLIRWLKDEAIDLSKNIFMSKDNLILLDSMRGDIEEIINDVTNSKTQIISNYEEYYKNYIAACFIIDELEEIKRGKIELLSSDDLNEISKRNIGRDIKKIDNRLERLEISKNLINLYVEQEQNISDELEIIADIIDLEYKEASDVVSMTLMSLIAQQPVKDWIDMWNMLQDLKNASIQNYVQSTNTSRDNMVKLKTSTLSTKKILIEWLKSTRANIEKNNSEVSNLDWKNKALTQQMKTELENLKKISNTEEWIKLIES